MCGTVSDACMGWLVACEAVMFVIIVGGCVSRVASI